MKTVFVKVPNESIFTLIVEHEDSEFFVQKFIETRIPRNLFWLDRKSDDFISVRLRLMGGKGGFGSNLRAQGSKMSSKRRRLGTDSYRDLSTGEHLRTLNQNTLIADYLKRKPEMDRQRDAAIREKMLKTIEAAERKPIFKDVEYLRTVRENVDAVETAVYEVLLGSSEDEGESDNDSVEHWQKDENRHNKNKAKDKKNTEADQMDNIHDTNSEESSKDGSKGKENTA